MDRFFSVCTVLLVAGVSVSAQITQDQKMAWFREAKFGNLSATVPIRSCTAGGRVSR